MTLSLPHSAPPYPPSLTRPTPHILSVWPSRSGALPCRWVLNHWFGIGQSQEATWVRACRLPAQGSSRCSSTGVQCATSEVPRPGALGCFLILLRPHSAWGLCLHARHQLPWLLQQVQSLGLLVFFSREVLQTVFWAAQAIHVAEGVVAYCIARKVEPENAVEWFIQTSLFGFWSLRLLLRRVSASDSEP